MTDPDLLKLLARERADEISRTTRFPVCCRVAAADVVAAWRRSLALTFAFLTRT